MRYTRFEIPGKEKRGFGIAIIQFFVLIPILAIVIGYGVSNMFIIPRIPKATGTAGNKVEAVSVFKLNKLDKIYFLQAGYYEVKEKASLVMNGIKQKGFNAFLGYNKGRYRIISTITTKSEEIQNVKEALKSVGYVGIINTIDIQLLDKSSSQDLKIIKNYINIAANIVMYQNEYTIKSEKKPISVDDNLKKGLTELQKSYEEVKSLVLTEDLAREIDDFNKYFQEGCNSFLKNAGEGRIDLCNDSLSNGTVALFDIYKIIFQTYSN